MTAYATAMTFWPVNHGVAETEEDMKALIVGAAGLTSSPVALLLPVRQAAFFRWCLVEGLRAVKPMTYMVLGEYRPPAGCHFPSVFY